MWMEVKNPIVLKHNYLDILGFFMLFFSFIKNRTHILGHFFHSEILSNIFKQKSSAGNCIRSVLHLIFSDRVIREAHT